MTGKDFSAPPLVFTVAKLDAAASQIASAIDALERGDIMAAVTLAGAAEGMLPEPAELSAFRRLLHDPRRPPDLEKEWLTILNIDRDWLKHEAHHLPSELTMQTDDAAFMLVRALTKLPADKWTPRMGLFKAWYIEWIKTRPRVSRFPEVSPNDPL